MIKGLMLKQKLKATKKVNMRQFSLIVVSLVFVISASLSQVASADRFDEEINALNQQTAQTQQQDQLAENEAANLRAVVSRIQGEITAIEQQIGASRAKRDETLARIVESEAKLAQLKKLLGDNIKQMYLKGDISTIELLLTSDSFSDYINQQEYQKKIVTKIKETLDEVTTLQVKLKTDKTSLDKLIADQQAMQTQLDSQRSEQNRLLALNQDQQAEYEQNIKANNAKIVELRRQQIAANARFTSGSNVKKNIPDTTGYPWANALFPNELSDPWGMYQRQCVSYTAWKVWKTGRHMPYWGGRGNANQWDDNARAEDIPVDSNPRVGSIAVSNSGYYGHVMYVEAVYDDGTIYISQYNAGWDGRYSEARISVGSLVFIHF